MVRIAIGLVPYTILHARLKVLRSNTRSTCRMELFTVVGHGLKCNSPKSEDKTTSINICQTLTSSCFLFIACPSHQDGSFPTDPIYPYRAQNFVYHRPSLNVYKIQNEWCNYFYSDKRTYSATSLKQQKCAAPDAPTRQNVLSFFLLFYAIILQGEVVYKNLPMSQGVYFVTKGIAEAYMKIRVDGGAGSTGETEEKVKGIVSAGKMFGYTRWGHLFRNAIIGPFCFGVGRYRGYTVTVRVVFFLDRFTVLSQQLLTNVWRHID